TPPITPTTPIPSWETRSSIWSAPWSAVSPATTRSRPAASGASPRRATVSETLPRCYNRGTIGGGLVRQALFVATAVLALASTPALALTAYLDYDKDYDFSKVQTYQWITSKVAATYPQLDRRIVSAI